MKQDSIDNPAMNKEQVVASSIWSLFIYKHLTYICMYKIFSNEQPKSFDCISSGIY